MKSTREFVDELDVEHRAMYDLISGHTYYNEKCECGEFLMKRDGPLSSRDQHEIHLAYVIRERFYW